MSELSELSEYKRGSDHFQRPVVGNVGIHEGFVSVLAQQTHGVVSIYVGIVGVVGIDEGFRPFSSFIIPMSESRNTRDIRRCAGTQGPHHALYT